MKEYVFCLAILAVVLASGCVNQEQDSPNTVDMINIQFVPETIEINVGDTVTWMNRDPVTHTITGFGVDAIVNSGETFNHTFNDAGTYDYACTIHPGMEGTVIVS
jgi:plastocyanin